MIDVPFAHVGGLPIEETIGSFGPALVVGVGVAWAKLRDPLRPTALAPAHATVFARRAARRRGLERNGEGDRSL